MKRVAIAIVCVIAASAGVGKAVPVIFGDPDLKEVVESQLWVWDPTPEDMLRLTSLQAGSVGIDSLKGLEYATNLQELEVLHNQISDLSPLSGLLSLQSLLINTNEVSDLTPLAGLTQLRVLDMHDNRISDVSPLVGLTNLETLVLMANQVSDVSPLSGLVKLQWLRLENNRISDISALAGLTELRNFAASINDISDISALAAMEDLVYLNLYSNEISDISVLGDLRNLRRVTLSANRINDISPLTNLTSLRYLDLQGNPLNSEAYETHLAQIAANNPGVILNYNTQGQFRVSVSAGTGGSVIDPGEGQFSYDEGDFVFLEARAAACYAFVRWSGSYSSSSNPALLVVDRDHTIEAVFERVCDTYYVDDDAPADPNAGDPNGSDPQEDGSLAHPYDTIQEAIDNAVDGMKVVVRPGTYRETIRLLGKAIQVTGLDPNGSDLPVIDGGSAGPVLSFVQGEDPNCSVTGFVITSGRGRDAGAILCSQSSPVIANCLIVGNRATAPGGAAVYCADSNAVFDNCTIADNVAGLEGAPLTSIRSRILLTNSILWGNAPSQIALDDTSKPTITYSDIAGGWPDSGNIDADPWFVRPGAWLDPNDLETIALPDDPNAVWLPGDYHLRSQTGRWDAEFGVWVQDDVTSPCIDTGDPAAPVGSEPLPDGGLVNMGAYGGTARASKAHEKPAPPL